MKRPSQLSKLLMYGVLFISATFMLSTIIPYFTFKPDVNTLADKQKYVNIPIWRISFYIHAFTGVLCLIFGATQFSKTLLETYPKLHRVIGRLYAGNILLINFPTAMVLSATAMGYFMSKVGLMFLNCLWFFFTYKAIVYIKQRDIIQHKNFMMRSYAMTFTALTVRAFNFSTVQILHLDSTLMYTMSSWFAITVNLLFVEWLIRRNARSKKLGIIKT